MSLDELKALQTPTRTRIEFADGLTEQCSWKRPTLRELAEDSRRLVRRIRERIGRRKAGEGPLRQSDIDARYERGVKRYKRRIARRLWSGAVRKPYLYHADHKALVIERRDKA